MQARSVLRFVKRLIPDRSPLRLGWHRAKALVAAARYGFPARKLTVIGVTGTDGKTTTVGMIAHILRESGLQVGALSTAFFQIREQTVWNATQKTSPSPFVVQSFLRRLVRAGCTHAVLEYSSHGLVQSRTAWTWPRIAAITNTSPEHLDYHKTLEQYRADKGILFHMLAGRGVKVLNGDDATYSDIAKIPSSRTIVLSQTAPPQGPSPARPETRLWTSDLRKHPFATAALLHMWQNGSPRPEIVGRLELPIPGAFNIENGLTAIGCALGAGVPLTKSLAALRTFRGIPGRMERIPGPQAFSVFVDFTVTPASYRKTLSAVRSILHPGNRLLVLTGSCGDRMREKRPEIGRICSELADVVVVTNEDPYTENPDQIIDEVWSGIDASNTSAFRIPDRRNAMEYLFREAREGDAVLLCGKGSDTTMMTAAGQIPWNEREIAGKMLEDIFGRKAL